ncbi:MAG: hypothetical protein WCD69_08780 [Xanthobacteraceae bacterium]
MRNPIKIDRKIPKINMGREAERASKSYEELMRIFFVRAAIIDQRHETPIRADRRFVSAAIHPFAANL